MDNNIVLYGASGHCKVVIDILQCNHQIIESVVDDAPKLNILGLPILSSKEFTFSHDHNVILSIGNNKVRKNLATQLKVTFVKAIHPHAIISKHALISEGTVVMAGAIVNPGATIGRHCIINTGAVVEHDCKIGDYAHISPNAALAGGVVVGEGTQIGIGSSIIQGIKIGKWAIIGAGAVIIKDIPDYAVVVGNPGIVIKINKNE